MTPAFCPKGAVDDRPAFQRRDVDQPQADSVRVPAVAELSASRSSTLAADSRTLRTESSDVFRISARTQENFSGARVIRAYVQEEAEIAAFETANQEYIKRSLKLVRLMGMLGPRLKPCLDSPLCWCYGWAAGR